MSIRSPRSVIPRGNRPMLRRSSSSKRGGFASITARKNSPSERIGVSIKEVDGRATITEIEEDGIFFGTALQVGDIVLSLNGQSTKEAFISDLIESGNSAEEKVTVVVRQAAFAPPPSPATPSKRISLSPKPNELEFEKDSKDQDVGIRFKVIDNKLMVSKILPCSIFQDTDLQEGDLISKVNDMDFHAYADADYALRIANKRGPSIKIQLRDRTL